MKREDNLLMREKILEATIACKIEAEGAELSLAKISSRAGISERTLNRYFPDKEILFYDTAIYFLTKKHQERAKEYLAVDTTGMNGLECLLLLLTMQISKYRDDFEEAKVFVRAYTTALHTALYRNISIVSFDTDIQNIIFNCIEKGIQDGSMRKDIIALDTYIIISSNFFGLVQRLIYMFSIDLPKEDNGLEFTQVFNEYIKMLKKYLQS